MASPFQSVTNLQTGADVLRRRRFGVIEMHAGRFMQVRMKPWPKLISLPEVFALTRWVHARRRGDRCWLYYNQPISCPNFLAVAYTISTRDCRLATAVGALTVLDEIARLKDSHAALADITCARISDRHMARYGWESHVPSSSRRHFIRRYYGEFPPPEAALALC